MNTLETIEHAIEQLSPSDFVALQAWFNAFAEQKYGLPTQLRQLPSQRSAVLAAAAAQAEIDYTTNSELTDFQALGPTDLYGESSSSVTR
jgi:hypothetical protein